MMNVEEITAFVEQAGATEEGVCQAGRRTEEGV